MKRRWTIGLGAGMIIVCLLAQCTSIKDIIIREAIKQKLGEELFVRSICALKIDCDFGQEASFEVSFKDGIKFFRCRCFDPQFHPDSEGDVYQKVNGKRSVDPDYMPLEANNFWVYDLLSNPGSQFALAVTDKLNVDDILYSPVVLILPDSNNVLSDSIPAFYLFENPQNPNDILALVDTTEPQKMFQHSYEEQTTIINGTTTYITDIGSVTVAAGTFESCFYITDSITVGMVFAPDVGLIRVDSAARVPSMELSSYSVNTSTRVSDLDAVTHINVYPNPTRGFLRIESENVHLLRPEVEVLDAMGRSVMKTQWSGNAINLDPIRPGVYYLRFRTDNRLALSKIVKVQ